PRAQELRERGQRGVLKTRSALELVQDPEHLDPAAARGDRALDARAVDRRADAVPVTGEQTREDRGEVEKQVALAAVNGPKVDGRREVEQEMRVDLPILEVLADVGGVQTRGDVPIDVADVVAERVFADVGEVQPLAFEDRAVVALEESVETTDDRPVQPLEAALSSGSRHVPATARSGRGCAEARASRGRRR